MAVVSKGFSIREYASKMRSIDVVKSWPFCGGSSSSSDDDNGNSMVNKQTMESLLPPITVIKFRWWSEELDLLKSTELANIESSGMENNKLQETQPRSENDLLQVNLHVGEKSDERSDMLECPVCGAFAASTVNALNAHVDSCLAQACREERRQMRMAIKATKSRAPKKRSIVEIFAAAPQIHMVVDAADDNNLLDENENGSLDNKLNCKIERPKKKKKKKKKVAIVKKLKKRKRKLEKNKNKKQDGLIVKKNGCKQKLQIPVNFNRKSNRGSNAVSILRKKPSLKCVSAKKKSKVVQVSKPIVEHEPSSPVLGILKNPTKCVSGQNPTICNLRATTQTNTCGVQHSVRHVSFSGKDGILGPHKKHDASFEKSICHIDLDSFDLSKKGLQNEGDKEFLAREINRSDEEDVSFSTENGIGVQATMEKQQLPDFHHNVDIPKFLRPSINEQEKINHFSDRSLQPGQVVLDSGNFHMSNQGNQNIFCSPPSTGVPRLFSAPKEIQNPFVNSQVCGGVSTALNYSSLFVDYFGDHTREVAISSKANPRASLQPLSSGFALIKNANESAPFTSENVSGHPLSHQPFYHLSPIELMGKQCPFPEWKQKAVAFSEKYRDEGYFGLPLNSQGELVQAKSSGNGGFNQLKKLSPVSGSSNSINNLVLPRSMDDHSIMKGMHFTERALPNNQLSLFPARNHLKVNATVHSPVRLGATELQGHRKEDGFRLNSNKRCNHSICLMNSDLNLMNISFSGCGQYDQFQNQKDKGITHAKENADKMLLNSPPPTMRLMGKDVTICRSSDEIQEFADGKVWTDKEIIKEQHPQSIALQNSFLDRRLPEDWLLDPASGKFKETRVQQFEIESSQAFPSNVLMKSPECNFFQPGLNCRANPEFHNSSLGMAGDPNPKSHHLAHPPTSHAIFDSGADYPEPFISRNETLRVISRLPAASTSHRNYQNINGNSVELENKQNLLNAGNSSFNFPFLYPDHVENFHPSWVRGSSKGLMPWLLQATQQAKAPSTRSRPLPEVGGRFHPHTARTSFLTNHLVPHSPVVNDHHLHMESSVGQPSVAHSPLILPVPGIKLNSSVNMSHRNRMKSKSVGIQDPDICQKTRKRPGAREDYSMKPIKIPNLGIQDESRAAALLAREKFIEDIQCNTESLEIEPERNEASLVGWIPNESQCNGFGLSAGIDSSKVDGVARSGPIKLSPGVKHILKPGHSQTVDQDNSRLIHSTIPFASMTDCGSILETQKKSTKIYRF
ncbi:uncharacterized protein LOC111299674 isoform X2 [Durio zibethinus]|uniref:Uncharacterized protein LOC111299674 isoform X2 n=1 Tax=Durio zibethinus TaxID=66656 RepID=A0A6P5ZE14_DURZI|nr:uncharacterized protein LOC111299674 isoform X2 [Durio zibethinus]